MVQPEKVDDVLRGSYRTGKLNEQVYSDISQVMECFESFLDKVSETMDVDIMPGELDFSNSFMPQQPFNSCLFPSLQDKQRDSINLATNPHQFDLNGLTFLGTSGQNVRDMLLNSETPEDLTEDDKGLEKIKQTLEMRHLCPTAPDTLRVYPFKESDPFVINSQNNSSNLDLNVGEDDQGSDQSLYTQVPHVYFVGNMQNYKEELLTQNKGKQNLQFVKVLSLPTFALTPSIVLLDLETLQSYEVTFDLSEGIAQKAQQEVVGDEDSQRYDVDMHDEQME